MIYSKQRGLAMDKLIASPGEEALKEPKKIRAKIEARICQVFDIMDPSGDNSKRMKDMFAKMSDTGFAKFMELVRKGEYQINLIMPNVSKPVKMENLLKAADEVGLKLQQKLWIKDDVTGKKYLTNESYLILTLPIRRTQQEWDKKLSVPSRDKKVDLLTGQVIGEDDAAALSAPEIQSLGSRGLDKVLLELVRVRGGDVTAYGDFKRQQQETGQATLDSLNPNTRVRSADVARVLMYGMMLDSNL